MAPAFKANIFSLQIISKCASTFQKLSEPLHEACRRRAIDDASLSVVISSIHPEAPCLRLSSLISSSLLGNGSGRVSAAAVAPPPESAVHARHGLQTVD
jgi:hypothetical protein